MSSSLGLMVLLGLASTGFHDHGAPRYACCEGCSGRPSALAAQIQVLRTSPRWRARDDAAEALRKYDWQRHPEAVLALCDALLLDPKDDVREEAAESLKKMAPCVPNAHEALSWAATNDREDDVRGEARDALKSLGKRCLVECHVCGPATTGPSVPTSKVIPPDWLPILAPDRGAFPTTTPVQIQDSGPAPEVIPPSRLPQALPDSDVPPPPPTPYQGSKVSSKGKKGPRVR